MEWRRQIALLTQTVKRRISAHCARLARKDTCARRHGFSVRGVFLVSEETKTKSASAASTRGIDTPCSSPANTSSSSPHSRRATTLRAPPILRHSAPRNPPPPIRWYRSTSFSPPTPVRAGIHREHRLPSSTRPSTRHQGT